ncbi:GSCOCG00002733001-RA-CDS [Cotesia congregata]|nr:GSCOCG00002733001-RA-CDS [Cotesia congregata]
MRLLGMDIAKKQCEHQSTMPSCFIQDCRWKEDCKINLLEVGGAWGARRTTVCS